MLRFWRNLPVTIKAACILGTATLIASIAPLFVSSTKPEPKSVDGHSHHVANEGSTVNTGSIGGHVESGDGNQLAASQSAVAMPDTNHGLPQSVNAQNGSAVNNGTIGGSLETGNGDQIIGVRPQALDGATNQVLSKPVFDETSASERDEPPKATEGQSSSADNGGFINNDEIHGSVENGPGDQFNISIDHAELESAMDTLSPEQMLHVISRAATAHQLKPDVIASIQKGDYSYAVAFLDNAVEKKRLELRLLYQAHTAVNYHRNGPAMTDTAVDRLLLLFPDDQYGMSVKAAVQFHRGQFALAKNSFLRLRKIHADKPTVVSRADFNLGLIDYHQGHMKSANELFRQALKTSNAANDKRGLARAKSSLALTMMQTGDLLSAAELCDEAESHLLPQDIHTKAVVQSARSALAMLGGDFKGARELASSAQKNFEAVGDVRNALEQKSAVANIDRRSDKKRALLSYNDVIREAQHLNYMLLESITLHNRAQLRTEDHPQKALNDFRAALELDKAMGRPVGVSANLRGIAVALMREAKRDDLAKQSGDFIDLLNEAISESKKCNDEVGAIQGVIHLASVHLLKGDVDEAAVSLSKVDSVANAISIPLSASLSGMWAMVETSRGNLKEAEAHVSNQRNAFRSVKDLSGLSAALGSSAQIAMMMKKFDRGLEYLQEGIKIDRQIENHVSLASKLLMQGMILAPNDSNSARKSLIEAKELFQGSETNTEEEVRKCDSLLRRLTNQVDLH